MDNHNETALVPSTPEPGRTPIDLLHAAIEKGIDADGIVKLTEGFARMEAKRAEQEYIQALIDFRRVCPPIPKTKKGAKDALFAPLPEIARIIDPLLVERGLTYSFNTLLKEETMQIDCKLYHAGGHSTITTFFTPIDKETAIHIKMTATHAGASASSFGKRYALQLALGLVTGLPDDDGQALLTKITPEQVKILQALLDDIKPDMAAFFKYAKVEKLEDILLRDYGRLEAALFERRKQQKKSQGEEQK